MSVLFIVFVYLYSYYLLKILIPYLKKNLPDLPNDRSLHQFPIPRGGGVVFPIQSLIIALISGDLIPLICLPLGIIGFLDDKYNVSSFVRFYTNYYLELNNLS